MDINSIIATLHNEGKNNCEVSRLLLERHGISLGREAVRERLVKMKNNGTLDFTGENVDPINILDEIDNEINGGLFKIGVLDIETTGLWADFGYVIVAVIKDIETNQDEVFRLDECKSFRNEKLRATPAFWRRVDKELLEKIRAAYETYDMIIHFNGRNFDIKFLNTRMLKCGVPLLPEMKQLDIYQIAKHRVRLRSKRLDALKDFLEVDQKDEGHKWEYWQMAGAGVKEGYDYVVEHCQRDVARLAEVARRMKHYINYINK